MTSRILGQTSKSFKLIQEKQSWFAIWCFVLLIALPLIVGIGKPLIFFFPISSFILGVFLYYKSPHLYIGFVWWIFFLANLIRRLIDYRSGYITPGPWGFTAVLVGSISLVTVFRYLPITHRKAGIPFVLIFCALAYSFLIGIIHNPPNAVLNSSLSWICPVAFSFHIFMKWQDYPKIKNIFIRTFLWGILVMGIYGVFQYIFAPPWEQFFLNNSTAISFGQPVPFGIRVFGSTGAPQVFAAIMLTGLITILCEIANPISYIASGFGYIVFILSMARSVWLSAAISIPLFFFSLKPNYQIRMIFVILTIFVIVTTTLLSWEPVYEKFYDRFETFLNLDNDNSLNERTSGYQIVWSIAALQILGKGIGFSFKDIGLNTALGANDGSFFPLLFTFGWVGLFFYLGGFLMLFIKLLQIPEARLDIFISACRMIAICILLQAGLNSIFNGLLGLVIWSFTMLGLAGHKYYNYHINFKKNDYR